MNIFFIIVHHICYQNCYSVNEPLNKNAGNVVNKPKKHDYFVRAFASCVEPVIYTIYSTVQFRSVSS